MRKNTFVLLCLEGALLSFNVAACAALVPSVAGDFGLSQFIAGRIIWIYMIPYGIAALVYGPLVRRIDAKKIELFCLFFFSLANFLAGFSVNIAMLFAARFFMGLFGASVIPLGIILIARHIAKESRGKYVGIFFSATFAASVAGLFLSGVIHWRYIFLIPAVLGLILWVFIYFFLPSFKEDKNALSFNYLGAFRNRAVLHIFTYIFLISLIYHGIQQWLAVYFSSGIGLSQFLISALLTLASLSGIFGEIIGGRLSDRIGRIKTVNLGILLMVLSIFSLVFKVPAAIISLIMFAWGLGWTINHAGISTILTDLPEEFLNEAASLNSSLRFVAGGIGMVASGLLMQKSFLLGFSVLGTCLVCLFFFTERLIISGRHS